MKNIILIFAFVAAGLGAYSQNKQTPVPNTQTPNTTSKKTIKHWCPNTLCTYSSMKSGICPVHSLTLVKEGDYYCEPEYMASVQYSTDEQVYPLEEQGQVAEIKSQNGQPGVCANGQETKKMKSKSKPTTDGDKPKEPIKNSDIEKEKF